MCVTNNGCIPFFQKLLDVRVVWLCLVHPSLFYFCFGEAV